MNMRTMITIGVVVVLGGFALITGLGKTSAGNIEVGACFEDPGAGGFSSVKDQDCAGPHDIQVYDKYIGEILQFGTSKCAASFNDLVEGGILDDPTVTIPEDTVVGEIGEEGGGGETLCFIESPSGGLVGSVVP